MSSHSDAENRIMSLLGFAQRSRKIVAGEEGIRAHIQNRKAKLILIAGDAKPQRVKEIAYWCSLYGTKNIQFADQVRLGRAIGQQPRTALAVLDFSLADAIIKIWDGRE